MNGYIFIAGRNSKELKYELFCRVVNTGLKCSANSYRCEIQKNRRVERRDKLCLEKLKKSCRVEEEVNGRERKFAKGLKKGIKLNEFECILASMRDEIQKINESFSGEGG